MLRVNREPLELIMRAITQYLENISDELIGDSEMIQKEALVYSVDADGRGKHRSTLRAE